MVVHRLHENGGRTDVLLKQILSECLIDRFEGMSKSVYILRTSLTKRYVKSFLEMIIG